MKFYGTKNSLVDWKAIIEKEINTQCSEIKDCDDGAYFETNLTTEDRDFLQREYWNRRDDNAPLDNNGKHMPWNWRISFG